MTYKSIVENIIRNAAEMKIAALLEEYDIAYTFIESEISEIKDSYVPIGAKDFKIAVAVHAWNMPGRRINVCGFITEYGIVDIYYVSEGNTTVWSASGIGDKGFR